MKKFTAPLLATLLLASAPATGAHHVGLDADGQPAEAVAPASAGIDSGYDRDNWDFRSRAARLELECSSSEHVDHIVALKEAYDSGAHAWTSDLKAKFANDLDNLWCLEASVNLSKSDGDLAEWSGGSCAVRKHIATVTLEVKAAYSLEIDAPEQQAIDAALALACP